jgi:hypothetical protein
MLPIFYDCSCGFRASGRNLEELFAKISGHVQPNGLVCYQNVILSLDSSTKSKLE